MIWWNTLIKATCILLLVSTLYGCRSYYGEGLSGGAYSYMHTAMTNNDSALSNHIISGRYSNDISYYLGDKNESGELSYHYGISKKNLAAAYGAGAFFGRYSVSNLKSNGEDYSGNYTYGGLVLRAKTSYNIPFNDRFHWRIIGIQGSWHIEKGEFYDFKQGLLDLNEDNEIQDIKKVGVTFYNVFRDITNFNLYPYTEFAIRASENIEIIPNFGIGYRLNSFTSFRAFSGISVTLNKRFSLWGSHQLVTPGLLQLVNDSFVPRKQGKYSNTQFGLSIMF